MGPEKFNRLSPAEYGRVKILIATSEAVPFAKTGGLADVCGALPVRAWKSWGTSRWSFCQPIARPGLAVLPIEPTGVDFEIPIGNKSVRGSFLKSNCPIARCRSISFEQDEYFDRPGLYQEGDQDYSDNCERFVFFNRAVMEAIRLLDLEVDVLHANDWQTGLLAAYLKAEYRGVPGYEQYRHAVHDS